MPLQAEAAMLIHKSPQEVFDAMVNPEVMSKIWFTHSTGPIEAGQRLKWTWGMYNVSAEIHVESVEAPHLIRFTWPSPNRETTVEMIFTSLSDGTFLQVTESGWEAGDENLLETLTGQTAGWTMVLAALKAYLEHNIILTLVRDRFPEKSVR